MMTQRTAAVRGELREHGVAVFLGPSRSSAKLSPLEAPIWLRRAVRAFDPNLIHLHTEIPEFTWAVSSLTHRRLTRRPVVRTIHNAVLWGGWWWLGRISEGRLDAAIVVAVSEAVVEGFAVPGGARRDGPSRPSGLSTTASLARGPERRSSGMRTPYPGSASRVGSRGRKA